MAESLSEKAARALCKRHGWEFLHLVDGGFRFTIDGCINFMDWDEAEDLLKEK